MSLDLRESPTRTDRACGDDLFHLYCCDENVSLCGLDITDHPLVDDPAEDERCVVCEDLWDEPCSDPNCPDRDPP